MAESIIDKSNYCVFCGAETSTKHHLIFGLSQRQIAEDEGVYIPVCDYHHTLGDITRRIHDNTIAERLSKMYGQVCWEKRKISEKGCTEDEAREMFIKRFGRNYA
jgi:thymidine kinase